MNVSHPLIEEIIARYKSFLPNPRDTVGPGRFELGDALEMDGGAQRVPVDQELLDVINKPGRTNCQIEHSTGLVHRSTTYPILGTEYAIIVNLRDTSIQLILSLNELDPYIK